MSNELMGMALRVMLLAVSAAFLVAALAVYSRARDRVWNRIFAAHALCLSAWIFSNFLIESALTPEISGLWLRLAHPLAALVVCTCVDLAWVFPERITAAPMRYRLPLYLSGAVFGSLGFSPYLYKSLHFADGFVVIDYDWAFAVFGLFIVLALGYADYLFLRKIFRLKGLQRVQVIYIFAGMMAGQGFAAVAMIFIPLVYKNTIASHWGAASYVFMVAGMTYSIAKYRLVRPQVALIRAAAYTLTGAISVALVLLFATFLHDTLQLDPAMDLIAAMLGGVVTGMLVLPLHAYLRGRLETRGGQGAADGLAQQKAVEAAVLRNLRTDDILQVICDTLMASFHPVHVRVMLRDPERGDFVTRAQREARSGERPLQRLERLPARHLLVRLLATERRLLDRDDIYRFASMQEAFRLSRTMDALEMHLVAPLLWENSLRGLVCLGEKRSGEMYDSEELDQLVSVVSSASLALQNAETYAQMAQMREFSDNILRDMEGGVIAVDADGRVILYNPAAAQIIRLEPEEVLGRDLTVLPQGIQAGLTRALRGGTGSVTEQLTIQRADGSELPVACSVSRLGASAAANRAGALAVIHDLSLVRELEREREEAERLSMIRVLAAGMAHEIRNPLVAIQTFADLLPLRWDDEEFRQTFMVTAQEEIQRIVALVSELLLLSKPAGTISNPVDLAEVCEGVVRALSARAEARSIRLQLFLSPLTHQPLGDAGRLHQALQNLVGNALDAEPEGGEVRLFAEETAGPNGASRLVIRVANPHSVISPQDLEEIFKPFYSRKEGGTGLGLAICQTIVQEHHGTIEVRSAPLEGTEFVVRLPAGAGPAVAAQSKESA